MKNNMITATWPVPNWVKAVTITREWDFSRAREDNRRLLSQVLALPLPIPWLQQTHGNDVWYVEGSDPSVLREGDGSWTDKPGQACVVLTGDCLPLLLCDTAGSVVGAVHAGWKGILKGIIENAVRSMRAKARGDIIAWMGPAIGPHCFEVGREVGELLIEADPFARGAFCRREDNSEKWLANIYELAKSRLRQVGVNDCYGGEYCTYTDEARFFSARRTKTSERMATLIWR